MQLIWILVLYSTLCVMVALSEIRFLRSQKDLKPEILSPALYESSIEIGIANKKFEIFSTLYTLFINVCWLAAGLGWLKSSVIKDNTLLENTLFLLIFLLIFVLTTLPLNYFKEMIQDKKHGFSNMNLKLFIKDSIKAIALTAIIGFVVLYALLFCVKFLGSFWWIAGFLLSFCIVIIANVLYPTLIAPIFNKMTPLNDESLLASIKTLMDKSGFKMDGVFIMDASLRDKRLNAFFAGLFKSKRVVLFDTLLKAMKEKELLAVLAHELGHFKHKDILKNLFNSALLLFIMFFIMANLPTAFYEKLGLEGVDSAVFLVFIIFGNILSFIFMPLINHLSRIKEYAADAYAAKQVGSADMKAALLVLARENKAFIRHSSLETFFNQSHPSIANRLKALDKY